jgi:integrase
VFSNSNGTRFSDGAMLQLLKRMGYHSETVTHGLRATCRTWAEEKAEYPYEVREAALAHKVEDQMQAAYQRGDRFEKRRGLMQDWAAYCTRGVVVPFAKRIAG